ncbi:MAG TPA: septal ring lytic transglycosylase RlpA family protein [Burkholderiales bacterium]|nr:septal ring lytic transglycosylase RlpA family protein [Burkholderiales bacterium]
MRKAALPVLLLLGACSSTPERTDTVQAPQEPRRPGGYYKDDGPGDQPPPNLSEIPDAEPRAEPMHRWANRPYTVFGRGYTPMSTVQPYREQGIASWYGKKFHGQKTSSGEVYDMYRMTGAHKTLPIPSYARVTNLANGRSVVVRINDRGPFHADRIIDLSYAAAHRLGYVQAGSARVEVESVLPGEAEKKQAGNVYIQVGAFSVRNNAEDLRARVATELPAESLEVISVNNLWRLHVGPYGTQDAARAIAERLESLLSLKGFVVVR